jgi:MFS family permease
MRIFTIIWFGQLVSLLGTAMTRFALLIWAYEQTGKATTLALLGFFSFGLDILLSPIAGVWVDRWDRRLVLLFADLGAGLMTVTMLILYMTNALQIWHLYVAQTLTGGFAAFQAPAYTAATTMLVPKSQYTRTSGMRSLASSTSQVLAPVFAGVMLRLIDIEGVMLVDIATFLVAVTTLLIVRIPQPTATQKDSTESQMWREIGFGFRYIRHRRGLLGLVILFMGINFFAALTYFSILPAMILARSGRNELTLATVQAALGIGGVVGGLLVSIWGGPKRKIHSICAGTALSFLLGDFLLALGRNVQTWALAAFLAAFFIPFISSAHRAIWQAKVAPEVQGRVFSVKGMLELVPMPLGYLLAGPLADHWFEPAMMTGGSLEVTCGWLVGTGPGAGMALMFACNAILGITMSLSGYLFRVVRHAENDLPDHDAMSVPQSV